MYFLEGIRAGLLLALLVGPLVIMLLQLSLRRGTLSAFAAALGIWVSDLLFIAATHYGMASVENLTIDGTLGKWVGGIGVLLLLGTSIYMWFKPPPDLLAARVMPNKRGLIAAWLQGFALNTFNPFTVGFWTVFTLTQVRERGLDEPAAWAIYAGILGTIVFTDIIKVLAARKLRSWLKPNIILKVQRVGALALGVFGLVLGWRVFG